MNIAIYQGFTEIHFEMLGYLIDYFIKSKIPVSIIAHMSQTGLEWKNIYEKIFNINMVWLSPTEFNPDDYELIILLTDDDMSFNEDWINKYGSTKIICIDHWGYVRRKPKDNDFLERIGTRFFNIRPQCKWALPCYQVIDKNDKINNLLEENKINITCIGIQNRPPSGECLMQLFKNFNDLEFSVITRQLNNNYEGFNNIKTFEKCPTDKMMEILRKTHYVLCFDNPHNPQPINNSISAAIPLAFNFGCKLIIPKIWQKYYNFKNIIIYDENNMNAQLELNKNMNLDSIYNELYSLISHRNRVFDNAIKLRYSKLDIYRPNNSIYSQICKFLFYDKPNIFINFENNIHLENGEFREIYQNIKYDQFILEINESIIFNINYLNNDLFNILKLLSNRSNIDIIVINNIESNFETNIKNNYTRQYIIYNINELNIIILFTQR